MFSVFVELDFLGKVVDASVYPYADEAAFSCGIKFFDIFAFSSADNRCHKLDFGAFRKSKNLVNNLVDGLLFDFSSADRAMRNAYSCIEQTEIVIDFRNCSDSGTGVFACVLLVNGNCRGKSVDGIHVRFFHHSKEHSCIGRKAFHISALAVGIYRIKRKGTFSRTGKTG